MERNGNVTGRQADFSVGSVKRQILRLALPMTLAQLVSLLYNLVDRIYIGRMDGRLSLSLRHFPIFSGSAVRPCFPLCGAPGTRRKLPIVWETLFCF